MKLQETVKEVLVEQKWYDGISSYLMSIASPITASVYLLKKAIELFRGANFNKVRLIFPMRNWELNSVKLLKEMGVVTGVFTSLDDAKKFCKELIKTGVKADEFVIGSHGEAGKLLMNKTEDIYWFDNSFLNDFKPIIKANTKVFFTACHGADFLETLKNAADTIGVGVYGSSGVYNYITNSSEKGFYYCSYGDYKQPTTSNVIKPYLIDRYKNISNFYINESDFSNEDKQHYNLRYRVFVKGNSVKTDKLKNLIPQDKVFEGLGLGPISKMDSTKSMYNWDKKNQFLSFDINFLTDIMLQLPKFDSSDFQKVYDQLVKAYDLGQIKLTISTKNGYQPLEYFKPFKEPADMDNKFFLDNKLCKKIDKSPVSWVQ
jgi:hypothetical protein